MKLLWTKSNLPLGRLIRWSLNEPVSHFAFVFDKSLVIHSDLLGIQIKGLHAFSSSHEIILTLPYNCSPLQEEALYYDIVNRFDDTPYDYQAFTYFAWRAVMFKMFGTPLPTTSKYNDGKAYLCTEMAGLLPGWTNELSLSITSPYKLYQYCKNLPLCQPKAIL